MVKIGLIEFTSNLAVSIGGAKREDFKKGTKIIVSKKDIIPLLRLGCKLVGETEISYKKDKDFIEKKIPTKKKKAQDN